MKKLLLLIIIFSASVSPFVLAQEDDSIRKKVEEKIENALNNPKAYVGTVTDLSENSLQLNKFSLVNGSDNNEIIQVDVNGADIVKTLKDTQDIDFDEIAIGDFVTAMGFVGEKEVLSAERLIVSALIKPSERKAISGTITDVSNSDLTLLDSSDKEITLDPVKGVDYFQLVDGEMEEITFSDFENGDIIIASGILNEDTLDARVIFITSKATSTDN